MAHHALGHEQTARDRYDRAVASMAADPNEDGQLYPREVTRLLGD
ncbi:MAG: hypothetical protein ACI8QZ_003855 [Chlamydiales bacterium]|jgi:hypothetical protein